MILKIFSAYYQLKNKKNLINLLLFFITIITTTLTGSLLRGKDPFVSFNNFSFGIPYSFAIMMILLAHEMGHYLYAVKYKISATLPYFIPFFLYPFSFGTLGAFIKMRSAIPNKKALLDVGIAGPIAGFMMSLFFVITGFYLLPDLNGVIAYVSEIHPWSSTGADALTLGNSILFDYIRMSMGTEYLPMYEIYHFPFIFAGWIGLLVTALNLMPIGQLDGGHISYALLGKKARIVGLIAFIALALLNFYATNWLLWTVLILFLIRLKHPPTLDDSMDLDRGRKILAWISYIIFIVSFSPKPLYFG
jgi:membrane-associated protease RseP (regulator of RpoE activity)